MTADQCTPLVVRRIVKASRERVFAVWTDPRHLLKWWGPKGVQCVDPAVDLRVGGSYRIGNQLPDGSTLWIAGEYEEISPPEKLIFSWRVEGRKSPPQQVIVELIERNEGRETEVVVIHKRIPDQATYEDHLAGWIGCLDGLCEYMHAAA